MRHRESEIVQVSKQCLIRRRVERIIAQGKMEHYFLFTLQLVQHVADPVHRKKY